jgi:hypothetical protein
LKNDYISGKARQLAAQALQAVRQNNWNKVVIEAEGQTVGVTINRVQAAHYEEAVIPKGVIALRYHAPGDNFKVRFRNLRMPELE